ncbi:GA-like domain-containing protein, partial [Escherichia coli]
RLDAVDGIQVPAVNDTDGNGKPDSQDAQEALDAAEDLVAKAEEAEKVAEDALKAAGDVIDQPKHDDLTAKHDAVVAAKTPAEAAVNNLPEGPEKEALKGRLDAVDGIQVPAVNDTDGNGKPDSQDAAEARVFYEKAFSNVYQTDDLYAKTDTTSLFAPAATKLAKSTAQWTTILEKNAGAQMSQDQNAGGETRYLYNGSSGSDVITVGESFGGTGLNMAATRNDMKVMTGDGDDIIITGRDYGRLASSGQWDYKYLTEMGDGNDTLIVGASNSNLNVILFNDGSIGAVNKDNSQFGDVIPFDSAYDTSYGGQISGTTIDMGSGNDTVLALGYESGGTAVINATIKLGAGNDTIQINGDVTGGNSPSVITGDAGMDTLIITNGSVFSEHFSGFEKIELGSKGEVKIVAKDLVGNDSNVIQGGMLKITGNSDSKVDLDGEWIKGETWNEGDITYTSYTHESAPGISVLIEDKITQII